MNGYVRGGLLNRRERRRLPLSLPVHYGADEDRPIIALTRDINEEGVFIVSEAPMPENTLVHFSIVLPTRPTPLELAGVVSHTVIVEDDDTPGMGIVFQMDDATAADVVEIIDELDHAFMAGTLPKRSSRSGRPGGRDVRQRGAAEEQRDHLPARDDRVVVVLRRHEQEARVALALRDRRACSGSRLRASRGASAP